nr:bacillithiol biosynthesis BshC [Lacinutrix neustonica]
MPTDSISFQATGYFSKLIADYLAEADALSPLYNRFPKLENFKIQMEEKSLEFSEASENRIVRNAVVSI